MEIIKTEHLKKYYGEAPNQVKAVDDVSFSVEKGEFVAIIGSSGSGKSTLLNLIGGLDSPTSGSVSIDGVTLGAMTEEELTLFRRKKIGFIFQNYNLIPILSVYENIVLPVEMDMEEVDQDFLAEILAMLSLQDKTFSLPNTLSGGQQQRVAIARALITKPALILADEPTGNLDSKTSEEVLRLLRTVSQRFNQTLIMITHNPLVSQLADRVIQIEDGKIVP
ncbi:ABC transporter ATP-binding protein [Enterococcus sp. 669A]|uniref:ABC transporter ATP-binding protein n=1 Tax=Candidatus Enterococcus moelleringii TaxID=2815325 RepID=A0ABS3LCE9_9ENTE|nr:ABC transporter ATP-binding protein [Enterococcus sp. 669A]MBO1307311.1 ABC transporter ATP-binding protein [Enterococcus sp. 669A]